MAQWIEHRPVNQRVTGSISSQGTCLCFRPGPQEGVYEREPHMNIFLSYPLFLPPFPSLKINKKKFLKIVKENFPNLVKEIDMQVQEAQRVPNKMEAKKPTPRHLMIKTLQVNQRSFDSQAGTQPLSHTSQGS